jgi:glycine/D-amino acid oxidase-like deaminating enzyme
MPHSALVIGAGVFGLTTACELRRRRWTVSVLDAGRVPRVEAASTDVSKIVRMDYGGDVLYTAMAEASMQGWDEWNERWPAPLYHEDGFVLLASEPMQPGGFEYESFTLLAQRGHPVTRLRDLDRAARIPEWAADRYPDGYLNARAGWAESGRVVERLLHEARGLGAQVFEEASFAGLIESGGRVHGVTTEAEVEHQADVVIMATGAWTPALLPHLAGVMWTTAQPVIHVDAGQDGRWRAPGFPVWAADIARTGWYGFPALTSGALKIGHHGSGRRVDPRGPREVQRSDEDSVRRFLADSLPSLADAPIVERRLCLYCDKFDGDFWIDHDPERPGLVVAAGDSGQGFKFAPVIGGLIADVVEGRRNEWADRFSWRRRLRDRREAARAATQG